MLISCWERAGFCHLKLLSWLPSSWNLPQQAALAPAPLTPQVAGGREPHGETQASRRPDLGALIPVQLPGGSAGSSLGGSICFPLTAVSLCSGSPRTRDQGIGQEHSSPLDPSCPLLTAPSPPGPQYEGTWLQKGEATTSCSALSGLGCGKSNTFVNSANIY